MASNVATAQHTPGPWTARAVMSFGGQGFSIDSRDACCLGLAQGILSSADARLIAAAPDLLAAARVALETLAPNKDDDFVWAAMSQLSAAIALAMAAA